MSAEFPYYHTYIENSFACENSFGARSANSCAWAYYNSRHPSELEVVETASKVRTWPQYATAQTVLPRPFWQGHEAAIACYWKVWELAFKNFRRATSQNRFVSDFSATAFNDCTFMWDSAFITLFGRYGRRVWPFQHTLDNFYAKQHPDGFICREIRESDGTDRFQRFDPAGTGPNVIAWSEWEYFRQTGDLERLSRVFPPLVAFSQWMRRYRTWPNGSYWSTGWSSGMDNQPRFENMASYEFPHRWEAVHEWYDHAHGSWVDATFQALLSARVLMRMAKILGRIEEVIDFRAELGRLSRWANRRMWSERTGFYHDLDRQGRRRESVKTIGAYWALLAGAVPASRLERFTAHLDDPTEFRRVHRCPSLSADTPGFDPSGGYWKGAVWPPTNYMLLLGLASNGKRHLAHEIALNHLENIVSSFEKTGTLWENYAPDAFGEGRSGRDFVGWTGVPPTAVLFEHIFGLEPDAANHRLVWDIRLLERHGVENYPFGVTGRLDLRCLGRQSVSEEPRVEISASVPLQLVMRWAGGEKIIQISGLKAAC